MNDQELGFFSSFVGLIVFLCIIAYHCVVADPKYAGS